MDLQAIINYNCLVRLDASITIACYVLNMLLIYMSDFLVIILMDYH